MLLSDIKSLLTSISSSIFLGEMPATPDNVIGVFFSGGETPEYALEGKSFEQPTFQVRVRNKSALTAIQQAEAVKDALDAKTELTFDSRRYISIFQQGDILPLGKDASGRSEYTVNFTAKLQR